MKKLGGRLAEHTRWRKTKDGRSGDSKNSKFETPEQIREILGLPYNSSGEVSCCLNERD